MQDLEEDGTIKSAYLQGIGIDKLIARTEWMTETVQSTGYYHSDALGSVRSLTDEDETEIKTYAYDAWGKVVSETGSSDNEYKFTSRRWEEEISLQYNRARFYDPELGRFITRDPLTGGPDDPSICYFDGVYSRFHRFIREYLTALHPDKHNRYVYCYNNPVNKVDPLGLEGINEEDLPKQPEPEPVPTPPVATPPPLPSPPSQATGTEQKGETADDVESEKLGEEGRKKNNAEGDPSVEGAAGGGEEEKINYEEIIIEMKDMDAAERAEKLRNFSTEELSQLQQAADEKGWQSVGLLGLEDRVERDFSKMDGPRLALLKMIAEVCFGSINDEKPHKKSHPGQIIDIGELTRQIVDEKSLRKQEEINTGYIDGITSSQGF